MKYKNILINFCLVIASCIFSLLFMEGILKVLNIGNTSLDNVMNVNENGMIQKSENEKLVYTIKPNIPGTTNSYGFRENREYTLQKPAGTKRIIALGDSVAHGVMVSTDKVFLSLLEEKYNQNNTNKIEILNLAASGYNTVQEVELFKLKGLQFQPDEVWIFYVLNDPAYDGAEFAAIGKSHLLFVNQMDDVAFLGKLRKHSNLWKLTEDYIFSKQINEKIQKKIAAQKAKFIQENLIPSHYDLFHLDEYFTDTKNSFKEIKELSKVHNFKLKVFIVPILLPADKYPYFQIHKKVENTLVDLDIPVFDLIKYLDKTDIPGLRISNKDELHLSEKGHSVFADLLIQFIDDAPVKKP